MGISNTEFRNMNKHEQAQWLAEVLTDELGYEVHFDGFDSARVFIYYVETDENPREISKTLKERGYDAEVVPEDGMYITLNPYNGLPEDIFDESSRSVFEEQQIFERDWKMVIDISQPWEQYDANKDVEEFKNTLANILEDKLDEINSKFGEEAEDELAFRIVDDLRSIEADEEEVNYILNNLYDWADDWSVWIKKGNF